MAKPPTKAEQDTVDAILALLPKEPVAAFGVSIAVCASTGIDAGVTEDGAVRGLLGAMSNLRRRGAGERRH